jgi:hypothetical protein
VHKLSTARDFSVTDDDAATAQAETASLDVMACRLRLGRRRDTSTPDGRSTQSETGG